MDSTFDPIKFAEDAAARNLYEPQLIVEIVRREAKPRTDFGQLCTDLEARIADLAVAANSRPDHTKLKRGIDTMREVAELLAPSGAEAELADLAKKIRVCVTKSDNYAVTAGKHLREARERCREIGLDFNKWCAQAGLGIKRSRIYQLMGPDPIAAERRDTKHNEELENVQSVDVAQLPNVEPLSLPQPEQPGAAEPIAQAPTAPSLRDLPFEAALAQFEAWYAWLTLAQTAAVMEVAARVTDNRVATQQTAA
jgi:hypothetical protein